MSDEEVLSLLDRRLEMMAMDADKRRQHIERQITCLENDVMDLERKVRDLENTVSSLERGY